MNLKNIICLKPQIFLLSVGLFFNLTVLNSFAGKTDADKKAHLTCSLISESEAIVPGKNFTVGLKLKIEPHWHVYWINPGDAGLPVSIAWDLPKGFSADPIQWPYPERIAVPPLMNYGYENEVLLPIEIHAPTNIEKGSKIALKAKAKWIVCNEICLPGSAELALEMPVQTSEYTGAKKNPATENEFNLAASHLPIDSSPWTISAQILDSTLTIVVSRTSGMDEANTEQTTGTLPDPGSFTFFPLTTDLIDNAAPQKLYTLKNGYALDVKLVAKIEDTLSGVLVSTKGWGTKNGEKALLVHLTATAPKTPLARLAPIASELTPGEKSSTKPEPMLSASTTNNGVNPDGSLAMAPQSGAVKLLGMMFFAFVGGLILNLMPCVLPVLSLKIFDFVKRSGESRWKIFSHGLTFTAGVLISFWLLAGLLLILRSGGQQLGWGFQLQSPAFLIVLCALFFFFSLNLFGVFELGYMFTRIGGTGTQSGHAGSFFAGMTATVVATPCTAPFMGSAMGYAFTQPPYYAMLVFTFLGLGMAAPYLLLSGFPALMKFLPKPGAWMEHLKQFMGFPLLATAIWLAWVLGHQAGVDALVALLFILLLGGVSAWILGKWTALHHEISTRVVAGIIALVVFLPAFVLILVYLDQIRGKVPKPFASMGGVASSSETASGGPVGATEANPNEIKSEPFSEAGLAAYLDAGKPVFVDFTADWCLSCKVNERIAFGSQDVIKKFSQLQLTLLKADWTSRDEAITKALAKYGRSSIPFYVLYTGKGKDSFIVLPEVLSPGTVLQSLEQVKLPPTTL